MAKPDQKHLKWLRTLSTEEAWKQILKDATADSTIDPEKFLEQLSPLPNLKNRTAVRKWLDWVLMKIDLNMSVAEAKVLHICCDTLTALFNLSHK